MTDAFGRFVEAGHRVVLDRVDLARFDLAQIADRTLRAGAVIAIGAVWLAGAWFALLAAAVLWSLSSVSLPVALAVAGVFSAAAGALALYVGVQRATDVEAIVDASALRAASIDSGRPPADESRHTPRARS